jgi:outer membrane protein assembly factor BamB
LIDTSKLFCGTAASPLPVTGRVIIQVGSDIHGGKILGLDPATGSTQWEWTGLGPGYASPVVVNLKNQSQIVGLTEGSIVGVDARNGKELWSVAFPDEWHENISTPLWTGTHLIVSGTRQGTHAFTLAEQNGKWQATEVWKNPDIAMYMSSPVVGDGVVYAHSSKKKGQFVAFDEKTGAIRWATEGREGEHASLLLTPRNVVFLTNGGDLIVAKRGAPAFAVEHRYEVAESSTFATPVLLGSNILVRDATGLMLLTGK